MTLPPWAEMWALAAGILAIALLYSTVGHGGASGYLAVMALAGLTPAIMRPAALTLNILVASIATVRFWRAGWFSWPLLWPFAVTSIPFAALGGALALPGTAYRRVVGVVLLIAAWHLFRSVPAGPDRGVHPPSRLVAALVGAGLGFLAGLTGVGGGIFLSPLVLAAGWAGARETAAVSAAFILVNSVAGLASHVATIGTLPGSALLWSACAVVGGLVGSHLGSRRFGGRTIRRLLACILVLAAGKFFFSA